jgi:hypothetical protein
MMAAAHKTKPEPRFNPKEPLLARLLALVDTGMAVPRGEEMHRLVTELAALGPVTESQLTNFIKNRKSRLARMAREAAAGAEPVGAAAVLGLGAAPTPRANTQKAAPLDADDTPLSMLLPPDPAPAAAAAAADADVEEATAEGLAGGSGGSGSGGRGLAAGADAAGATRLEPMRAAQVVMTPEPERDELSVWLKEHKLDAYETRLREDLGGVFLEDLAGGILSTGTRPKLNLLLNLRASVSLYEHSRLSEVIIGYRLKYTISKQSGSGYTGTLLVSATVNPCQGTACTMSKQSHGSYEWTSLSRIQLKARPILI